jgi:hypothetical protein
MSWPLSPRTLIGSCDVGMACSWQVLQQGGDSLASLGGHDQHGCLGQGERCLPGTAGFVRNDDLGCRAEPEGAEVIMDGHHDRGRLVAGPGPLPWVLCQPVPGEAILLPQRRLLVRSDAAPIQQGGQLLEHEPAERRLVPDPDPGCP